MLCHHCRLSPDDGSLAVAGAQATMLRAAARLSSLLLLDCLGSCNKGVHTQRTCPACTARGPDQCPPWLCQAPHSQRQTLAAAPHWPWQWCATADAAASVLGMPDWPLSFSLAVVCLQHSQRRMACRTAGRDQTTTDSSGFGHSVSSTLPPSTAAHLRLGPAAGCASEVQRMLCINAMAGEAEAAGPILDHQRFGSAADPSALLLE
jgi:hypothetical protein